MTDEVKVLATTDIPPATKKAYEKLQKQNWKEEEAKKPKYAYKKEKD